MMDEKFDEKFDFSPKIQKNIKKAFKKFIKESKKIGKDFNASDEIKKLVILAFVNNTTERILDKNEKEQDTKYSEEERNYFKAKVFKIITEEKIFSGRL